MNNTQPRPGFRTAPKPTKKQIARAEKVNAFKKDLQDVFVKHGLTLDAVIKSFGSTASVQLTIVPYEKPDVQNWSEAKKENLEVRKACEHDETINAAGFNVCSKCGVDTRDFGENAIGVTAEYEAKELAAIEAQQEEEALAQSDDDEKPEEGQA